MKRGCIEHPKTSHLAALLGVSLAQAVGHLEMLFHFTAKYAPDGNVGRWEAVLAERCGWTGNSKQFIDALLKCNAGCASGYLDLIEADGVSVLCVHEWHIHCEDSVHMMLARNGRYFCDGSEPKNCRLSKAERARIKSLYGNKLQKVREQNTQKRTNNALPSPPLPSHSVALASPSSPEVFEPNPVDPIPFEADAADKSQPPEDPTPPPNTRAPAHIRAMALRQPLPVPPDSLLAHPDFIPAWNHWQQHVREKGQVITASAAKLMFERWVTWGPPRTIAAINFSIEKNWTSVNEEKSNANGNTRDPDARRAAQRQRECDENLTL